jgi:hypothetical protein
MKSKLKVLIGLLCFVLIFGSFTVAKAETILFPVIAINQPSVTTIISVYNWASGATHLHYTYRFKDSLSGGSPNYTGACSTAEFTRPTSDMDLVSFDASGTLNSGNALFGDTTSYGGSFNLPGTGARRAYLLVTHSDSAGNRVDTSSLLGGEAIIMDIASGAAWGYKAVRDSFTEDYTFVNYFDRGGTDGVFSSISTSMWIGSVRQFSFFPPNEWTNKFFVTPIGGSMTSDRTAIVGLTDIYNRTGTQFSNSVNQTVTCTAAFDLEDLVDSTIWSSIQSSGGWTFFLPIFVTDPCSVIVYRLEYVVNNPTYGGTNNNGYLLSTYQWP